MNFIFGDSGGVGQLFVDPRGAVRLTLGQTQPRAKTMRTVSVITLWTPTWSPSIAEIRYMYGEFRRVA